jgi:hypothetical protein
VDGDDRARSSPEARSIADNACQAIEPPTARLNPAPRPKPPLLARMLYAAANHIAPKESQ